MVITTGMIKPSWSFADVLALNALQNSMMLTPCGPRAVPTGGAGVALPAGICNFTMAFIFLAITFSSELPRRYGRGLDLLHLQEIQFHRRRPPEDGHQHPQGVAVGIDFVHFAR